MTSAYTWNPEASESGDDSRGDDPLIGLLRLADKVRARMDYSLEALGLSWARYEILKAVSGQGSMTYGELGRALGRHRTSIGVTVCSLEKSRLVAREPNPNKPQQILVTLSRTGRALLHRAETTLSQQSTRATYDQSTLDALALLESHFDNDRRPVTSLRSLNRK